MTSLRLAAQTTSLYSENWDGYTSYAATNLADATYAFPTGAAPALVLVGNNPIGGTAGSGVQLINWLAHSGNRSLLVRSGCEADINLYQARSGSRYQFDFWLYVHKSGPTGTAGTRNWYMRPGGMGADNNGDDYLAYRSDRTQGSNKIYNYNGITTSDGAWDYITVTNKENTWQHHRLSVDTASRTVTIFIDNMTTAVYSDRIARPDVAMPTLWRLQNEGTTTNDGYYAIDDLSLTVDNAVASLTTPLSEGFESYTAGTNPAGGPWITVACDGTGIGKTLNPAKVKVVGTNTVTPHSGTKCLMIQGGQRAGVSLAWGTPPQSDVQVTWWARVPAVNPPAGQAEEPLRMSLYNTEGGSTYSGDSAILGWGVQPAGTGGPVELIYYPVNAWVYTGTDYTPSTWEEYQVTTCNSSGTYSMIKNPSSLYPEVIVSSASFISSATTFGPTFLVAFSSSQGTNPPVYIDDITVKSGQAPVITANLPASVSVVSGGAVTLSVTAGGSGPFSYQWELNGTAIYGATNAALPLSGVDSSSQGVYTVLVSNGFSSTVSSGTVLTVYKLAVTGQWDFLFGDLRATVGADLQYVSDTTNRTAFPTMSINGVSVPVMAFGSNSSSQGFSMWHGAMPNGGGQFVNQYTLVMDLMFPESSSGQWRAVFQSDPFSHLGNDAEFYIGSASSSPSANGIGAEGQYDGALAPDTWYRVAFAVDLTAAAGQQLSKYVNGVLVGSQSLSGGVDGRYALGPAAQLFTTGLSGGFTQPGYVSSIQFVNGRMPSAVIAALGGPSAAKLPPGDAVIQITNLSLNASQLTLNWGGPSGQFQVQNSPTLGQPVWQPIGTLSTNRSLTVPASGATGFYRVTQPQPDIQVGQLPYGEQSITSKEILRAAGSQLQFYGLPVDLALSPDGKTVYIKNTSNLLVVDAASWTLLQTLSYPGGGASLHGIAVSQDGTHVYVTGSGNELYDWTVTGGVVSFSRTIALASGSDPCGLAISGDGTKAYVCLSIANKLAVVNLTSGTVSQQISVGIAPWNVVLSPDGNTAYVSDWGGRFPRAGDLTMTSAGTAVVVDSRGVAASGVLSVVNLTSGLETSQVVTGLHPSDLALSKDGGTLYVANANSDTVTEINTQTKTVRETVLVRPSATLPFGSSSTLPFGSETDGLALSPDGTNLFVACAGNNALAIVELPNAQHTNSLVQGFFPTDWYPGAVVADSNNVYVANVKGLGSRYGQPTATSYTATSSYLGTANRIPIPSAEALSKYSAQVNKNGRLSQIQQAQQAPQAGQLPVPVPVRAGEPSVFQHVLFILKENKTYDEVFGDMAQGNGNSGLCIYPQLISPNHHALAQQYVLLDNFYCNGVLSAVGHAWCTEANDSDHLEKSFGGFVRSYDIFVDPLSYVPTGFIWNNVLQHGLSFRNYGEFAYASIPSGATWGQLYTDYTNGSHSIAFVNSISLAPLVPYTSTNVPGWNLNVPDQLRSYGFIKDLNAAQARGSWETFHFLWLSDDHTGGTPPAQAQVADNDLALGQIVEAVTKSAFGSNTVIFVIEDDPQSGYDHVDGHRSLCLVISPYTKRNQVVSTFFNQTGLLHTMEQIMGLPPMNQGDAMAPLMFDCFTNTPNFTPYTALPSNINLVSGGTAMLSTKARYYAKKVQKMDFSKPDRINDDIFNRYIWHSIKGDVRYPSEFVGGHGKGLKKLGLVLAKAGKDDDD